MKSTSTVHYQGKKGEGFQGDGGRKETAPPIGNPEGIHMRGYLKNQRSSGYNKHTTLSDIIDEAMLQCVKNQGHLKIEFYAAADDESKLSSITIYDDIPNGFMGLDINGQKNPLNFIHYGGHRHEDDEEWSQYGSGLTAASMCCAGVWTLTTRYKTQEDTFKYVRCKFCWDDMARDNIFPPQSEEISEEEYNKIHPFHKGTVFQYDGCRDSIFSSNFENVVEQLIKMISTKYYKALTPRQDGSNVVEYSTFDSFREEKETKAIEPEIPPTEDQDHPHHIYKYEIQVRRNDRGGERIIYREITPADNTRWFREQIEHSKFKAITNDDFETIKTKFSTIVDTLCFKGTRVSGTEWCSSGLPLGSLVMERYNRIMTGDIRAEGRYIGFNSRKSTGEYNYHYYHLHYKHKKIATDNFSDTNRKIIDGNLMINDTPLNRVLKECSRKLQTGIGAETKFKNNWKRKYMGEWDEKKSYAENLNPPPPSTPPPTLVSTPPPTPPSTPVSTPPPTLVSTPPPTLVSTPPPTLVLTPVLTPPSTPLSTPPSTPVEDDRILQCISSLSESIATFKEAWPDMDIIMNDREMTHSQYTMVAILINRKK